jgi:quercetin dioxygenase-like cupin family protein
MLVSFGPGRESGFHYTHTIDFELVVSGEVTLILEDGEIVLRAGDSAVVPGVVHAWRGGPDGCELAIFLLGLPASR